MIKKKIRPWDVTKAFSKIGKTDAQGNKRRICVKLNDPKTDRNSFLRNATERIFTLPYGQNKDFSLRLNNGSSLHMHIYPHNMLCHIDEYDPSCAPLKHLLNDTDAKKGLICGSILGFLFGRNVKEFLTIMGITTGIAVLSTKFSNNIYAFRQ